MDALMIIDDPMDPAPVPAPDPEPIALPAQTPSPSEKMCNIGGGKTAPLALLLSLRDPHCHQCRDSAGWVAVPENGKQVALVCSCCVDRYQRKLAANKREFERLGQTRAVPIQPGQRERAEKRVERLTGEVATLTTELAGRTERFNATNVANDVELDAAVKSQVAAVQDYSSEIIRRREYVAQFQAAVRDAEVRLDEMRAAVVAEGQRLARAQEGKALVEAMLADARAEIGRRQAECDRRRAEFEQSTSRLRKDIAKATGRLARARGYNGLPGEEG